MEGEREKLKLVLSAPPPRRGGCALQQMQRYLRQGASGEVGQIERHVPDLPGYAELR